MKVHMLNGSPQSEGCTNRALLEMKTVFEKEGIETEIFWIGKDTLSHPGCCACWYCETYGECRYDDRPRGSFDSQGTVLQSLQGRRLPSEGHF